jgi:hypothetical protein
MFNEVSDDLKVVSKSVGKMAHAIDREAANRLMWSEELNLLVLKLSKLLLCL